MPATMCESRHTSLGPVRRGALDKTSRAKIRRTASTRAAVPLPSLCPILNFGLDRASSKGGSQRGTTPL
jgi:hypothetical protein